MVFYLILPHSLANKYVEMELHIKVNVMMVIREMEMDAVPNAKLRVLLFVTT